MWEIKNNSLVKEFKFENFKKCFEFMTKVAEIAEDLNHHPTWTNTYNKLEIILITHDAGGITDKDHDMSNKIDSLFNK